MLQINTNIASLSAQISLSRTQGSLVTALRRLGSGLRINNASDDAAGLAISDRMTAQINGDAQAKRNANDGISLLQTADSALSSITDNFQRIRTLAVQAADGIYSNSDRAAMQDEVTQLVAGNFTIASQTQFNGIKLLDGSFNGQTFQVGANAGEALQVDMPPVFIQPTTTVTLTAVPLTQATTVAQANLAIAASDLIIDAVPVGASVVGAQPGQSSASAWAIAQAITSAAVPGVTVTAATNLSSNVISSAVIAAGSISINGVALGAISGGTASALASSAAAAIAAALGATGVDASSPGGSALNLSAADGRDISISESVPGAAAKLGLAPGTYHGQVTVSNTPSTSGVSLTIAGHNPGNAGFAAGRIAAVDTGATVVIPLAAGSGGEPTIDLSDVTGAASALTYIDTKLDTIYQMRADLGAMENRLYSIQSNLDVGALNLSAARSRIRDVDFAQATTSFTISHILQQSGFAMLAQANASPQAVLQLLSGINSSQR